MGLSARGETSRVIGAMSLDGSASWADGAKKRWQEIARWRLCARIMPDATHGRAMDIDIIGTYGGALPEIITHLNCIEISSLLPARAGVRNQVRT